MHRHGGHVLSRTEVTVMTKRLEILRDLSDKFLKWELPDEKLGALLVLANLTERHRARPETIRVLQVCLFGFLITDLVWIGDELRLFARIAEL